MSGLRGAEILMKRVRAVRAFHNREATLEIQSVRRRLDACFVLDLVKDPCSGGG
jgi:hypothetical protein